MWITLDIMHLLLLLYTDIASNVTPSTVPYNATSGWNKWQQSVKAIIIAVERLISIMATSSLTANLFVVCVSITHPFRV